MKKMYVEPAAYITPSMRKILEEGESKPSVLFEHLSRPCMDFSEYGYNGFTIFDDGSYYATNYKPKTKNGNLFSSSKQTKLDEKNYHRKLIFTSKELLLTINKFFEAHKEEINNLPESVSNPFVLDGDEDIVRINDKIISGGNIFHMIPYEYIETSKDGFFSDDPVNGKALELITTLYADIKAIVDKEKK